MTNWSYENFDHNKIDEYNHLHSMLCYGAHMIIKEGRACKTALQPHDHHEWMHAWKWKKPKGAKQRSLLLYQFSVTITKDSELPVWWGAVCDILPLWGKLAERLLMVANKWKFW